MAYSQKFGLSRNSPLLNVEDEKNNPATSIVEENNATAIFDKFPPSQKTPDTVKAPEKRKGNFFSNLWDDATTAVSRPVSMLRMLAGNTDYKTPYELERNETVKKNLKEKIDSGKAEGNDLTNYEQMKSMRNTGDAIADGTVAFNPYSSAVKGVGYVGQGIARKDAKLIGKGAVNLVSAGALGKMTGAFSKNALGVAGEAVVDKLPKVAKVIKGGIIAAGA